MPPAATTISARAPLAALIQKRLPRIAMLVLTPVIVYGPSCS
jgi:hypothetical protein